MNDFSRPERKKPISYLEREAFKAMIGDLEFSEPIIPVTDGWDPTPRPEFIDSSDTLPLGHIALQGDFELSGSDK